MSDYCAAVSKTHFTVAIMFGGGTLPRAIVGVFIGNNFRLRPIQIEETSGASHLLLLINSDRVMNLSACQRVIPGWVGVIEVCTRILSDIQPPPPQIEMELIGMARAASEVRRAQVSPGSFHSQRIGLVGLRSCTFSIQPATFNL